MSLSVTQVSRVFQTYRTQERIAELNKQAKLKTVQGQQDRVEISTKARELAAKPKSQKLDFTQPAESPPPFSSPASAPPEDDFTPMFVTEE